MNANVKTFRAADPRAALDAVKAAFGEEAVILHTRQVGGGLWGRPEIEITAASSGEAARGAQPKGRPELESEIASLRRVVSELRSEIKTTRDNPAEADLLPPAAARLARRLMQRGVESTIADELAHLTLRQSTSQREGVSVEAVEQILRKRLPAARTPCD